jgi:carboxymethylenebutenolidase
VLAAIGAFPERIDSMVSMYGGRLHTDQPDSPHLTADRISGELYFGVAEADARHWAAMAELFERRIG